MRARLSITLLLLVVACQHGGDGETFGLEQRQPLQGLTFPTGLPQPTALQPAPAFPALVFDAPVLLTAPPDGSDRVVVGQQGGLVRIFANTPAASSATTFLDLTAVVQSGGEEGLLGLCFHPDYVHNGWFYVYYTRGGPRRSVLSRFTVSSQDPNVADPQSEQVLLQIDEPFSNHNGGSLCFGPDGKLYVSVGDGGSANDPMAQAQDLGSLLGKILRLDDDGGAPADNPFVGTAGARGEIWAYGLRNPWRTSFDRATGSLWVGDVGQDAVEEIDVVHRGDNCGWRVYEGGRSNLNPGGVPPSAFAAPIWSYTHNEGSCVIGGYVYRGSALPDFIGAYLYADNGTGRVYALVHDGVQALANTAVATVPSPTSFGEDEAGELYACSLDGNIYKFTASGGGSGGGTLPALLSATGLFTDLATLTPTPGLIEYDVNSRLWSDGAHKRRFVGLPNAAQLRFDPTAPFDFPVGTVLVKHFEIDTPSGVRRLETRVLLHRTGGWQGLTYRWNTAGTDADLLLAGGDVTFTASPGGTSRQQTWHFPSQNECDRCHTAAAGHVLGIQARQQNRDFAYASRTDNQLRAWNHIGLFTTDIGDPARYDAMPDPLDTTASLARRARAYLAANCAQCHQPGGGTPVDLDLRYDSTDLHAIGVAAASPVGGAPSGTRIVAGNKEQSDLWLRLARRDSFAMPPLGSSVVDDDAVLLIGAWIDAGAGN